MHTDAILFIILQNINFQKFLFFFSFLLKAKPIVHLTPYEFKNKTKINKELIQIDNLFQTYKHQVKEGDTVRLVCSVVKSKPLNSSSIQWFINEIELDHFKKIHLNGKSLIFFFKEEEEKVLFTNI